MARDLALPAIDAVTGSPLNEQFTLQRLATGRFNELVISALRTVLEQRALYNPILIHAGIGQGKTHALQAMAWAMAEHEPEARVLYLTCETFASSYQEAAQEKRLPDFRNSLRSLDLLLIDDIQYLLGRNALQEEMVYTFDARYDAHRQMMFASDTALSTIRRNRKF